MAFVPWNRGRRVGRWRRRCGSSVVEARHPLDDFVVLSANVIQVEEQYVLINFSDPVRMPVWLFAGADVIVERNMALLFELNFGVTEPATNIFSFGLTFYFR